SSSPFFLLAKGSPGESTTGPVRLATSCSPCSRPWRVSIDPFRRSSTATTGRCWAKRPPFTTWRVPLGSRRYNLQRSLPKQSVSEVQMLMSSLSLTLRCLLFAIVAGMPANWSSADEVSFAKGLRERGLYRLAALYCQQQIDAGNLADR